MIINWKIQNPKMFNMYFQWIDDLAETFFRGHFWILLIITLLHSYHLMSFNVDIFFFIAILFEFELYFPGLVFPPPPTPLPNRHFFRCWKSWRGVKTGTREQRGIGTLIQTINFIINFSLFVTSLHSFHVICLQSVLVTALQLLVLLTAHLKLLAALLEEPVLVS